MHRYALKYSWLSCQIFMGICLGVLLAACAGSGGMNIEATQSLSDKNTQKPNVQQAYRLGAGDKLQVTVEGVKEHSGEFEVNGTGYVAIPFVGSVKADGTTLQEFEVRLTSALKNYVRNPQVRVAMLNYRPFYIQGEVKQGGQYEYKNGLDVRRAVAIAGGYTYRAIKGHVFIQHANDPKERKYSLNQPVMVQPGDNIRIPERFF